MFDLRYHVASLAAVFVALAAGILLGVAISGNLSDAQTSFERSRIAELEGELANERALADAIERRGDAAEALLEAAYPALMADRLAGRDVAVLFLGPVEGSARSSLERTLTDADAGAPLRVVAVDTPVDAPGLDDQIAGQDELASFAEDGHDFHDLGVALAEELVEGGDTPLWSTLSGELVEERAGTSIPEVEAAIVVQSWQPPEEAEGEEAEELQATRTLFGGLLEGLGGTGVPVVGVETTTRQDSTVDVYRRGGISSVDNVDTVAGRIALAVLLAGGQPGHYGVKDTAADGAVPPIEPVPLEPVE